LSFSVECPCGTRIENPSTYPLLFLKKELFEIDILCPNDTCYLRELGYVKFELAGEEAVFKEASFYPPFVTWNATQMGKNEAQRVLKEHLRDIVTKHIDWREVVQTMKLSFTSAKTEKGSGGPSVEQALRPQEGSVG
jgi:hypothetical protein